MENLICLLICAKVQITKYEPRPNPPKVEQRTEQKDPKSSNDAKRPNKPDETKTTGVRRGYASSYSATWGGCLGCAKHFDEKGQLYYNMANGERLDDTKFTLAYNHGALNRMVSVCNTTTGKCVGAKVTDRGGFENPKYNNRIADLSQATALAIGNVTDKTIIEVREID